MDRAVALGAGVGVEPKQRGDLVWPDPPHRKFTLIMRPLEVSTIEATASALVKAKRCEVMTPPTFAVTVLCIPEIRVTGEP